VSPGRRAYQYGRVPRPILYAESGVSDRACRLFAILTVEQFASKEDSPDPSLEEMAQWLGCSVDTAIRAVRELERAGMVERRKRRNGQRQATSEYILIGDGIALSARPAPAPAPAPAPSTPASDPHPRESDKPSSDPRPRDPEAKVQTRTGANLADQGERGGTPAQTAGSQTRTPESLRDAAHIRAKGSTKSGKAKRKPPAVARARDGGGTSAQGSLDGLTPEPPPAVQADPPAKALVPFKPGDQSEERTPARNGAQPDAQVLLGEHIDVIGERPPGREVGRLGAQIKTLLDEGIRPGWVRMGLAILRYRGLDVGKLGSCVNQAMSQAAAARNGDGRAIRDGQPRDANGRPVGWRQVAANGSVGITMDGGELDAWVENYRPPPPGVDPYLAFIRGGNAADDGRPE
jgi:hypothetical protein